MPADQRSFTVTFHVYCLSEGKSRYTLHVRTGQDDHEIHRLLGARGYTPQHSRTLWIMQVADYVQLREEADWLVAYDFAWE